jgi:hypothetical protein
MGHTDYWIDRLSLETIRVLQIHGKNFSMNPGSFTSSMPSGELQVFSHFLNVLLSTQLKLTYIGL